MQQYFVYLVKLIEIIFQMLFYVYQHQAVKSTGNTEIQVWRRGSTVSFPDKEQMG